MNGNRSYVLRYLSIVVLFCMICVVYLGRLFYIQISGRESLYDPEANVRYVTVQAVRGEIYDRNGVKLVENRYTYDLVLTYKEFAGQETADKNTVALQLLDALEDCNATDLRNDAYFAFDGYYPFYSFKSEVGDSDSAVGYRYRAAVLPWIGLDPTATAAEVRDYYVDFYDLKAKDDKGQRLYNDAQIDGLIRLYYDMDASRFFYNGEYLFAQDIPTTSNLMSDVMERKLTSVEVRGNAERAYLYPGYASHILGSVGPIYAEEWEYYNEQGYQMSAIVGKDGCEAAFEIYLHGMDGLVKIEETAEGIKKTTIREPVAGKDVRLTIDITLQIAAEDGLASNVTYVAEETEEGGACDAGAAVVLDPSNGQVLAIASYPTFDLMTFNEDYGTLIEDPAEPLRNRALNEAYAPGSTLKLGMAAIGMTEGAISRYETISCRGKYQGAVGCSTYTQNHSGAQDVVEAIIHSCNSFFCELGDRLGIRTMEDYLSRLGLGEATGLELGGATGVLAGPTYRGEIQSEEGWTDGMTWQAAIGQSDHKMSPLQLASYTGTVCNGGTRYAAKLLHSVYEFGAEEPYYQSEAEVLSTVSFTDAALSAVYEGMEEMAQSTAQMRRALKLTSLPEGVTVGGKTGTAQTGAAVDNATFVCSASRDGTCDLVIAVVLEQGAHGYNAAYTAGSVLEAFYR